MDKDYGGSSKILDLLLSLNPNYAPNQKGMEMMETLEERLEALEALVYTGRLRRDEETGAESSPQTSAQCEMVRRWR